jgi:hypothetical protein
MRPRERRTKNKPHQKKKAAESAALSSTFPELGRCSVLLAGMLIVVDALAHAIGFTIELALVLLREVAVVLGHIALLIVLQALLAALQTGGLTGLQLAILDAVGNAVLLTRFPTVHLIDPRMAGIDLSSAGAGSVAVLRLSRGGPDCQQTARCKD